MKHIETKVKDYLNYECHKLELISLIEENINKDVSLFICCGLQYFPIDKAIVHTINSEYMIEICISEITGNIFIENIYL